MKIEKNKSFLFAKYMWYIVSTCIVYMVISKKMRLCKEKS